MPRRDGCAPRAAGCIMKASLGGGTPRDIPHILEDAMLRVTLPGTGGMMPLKERALACAMLTQSGRSLLIDCGEGTQTQIRACGLTFKPIDAVLITHFHGDHVSGLPGLLLSMGNQGREAPVVIAGPTGVEHIVDSLRVIAPELPFDIAFEPIDPASPHPFEAAGLRVLPFPLDHAGMPCLGYRLTLPRPGRFLPERARENGVPLRVWNALQRQPEVTLDGATYTREMAMTPPRRGITVTYATDTRPTAALVEAARDCDLLICEAMFGTDEKLPRAQKSGHMLMSEAAAVAAQAGARRLWLTHYSPAMPDPSIGLDAARAIFPAAEPGFDGLCCDLPFTEG